MCVFDLNLLVYVVYTCVYIFLYLYIICVSLSMYMVENPLPPIYTYMCVYSIQYTCLTRNAGESRAGI